MNEQQNNTTPRDESVTAPASPQPVVRFLRRAGRVAGFVAARLLFGLIFVWCLLAMWYSEVGPGWLRAPIVLAAAVAFPFMWYRAGPDSDAGSGAESRPCRRLAWRSFGVFAFVVIVAWQFKSPSNDKQWTPDMAVLPEAVFEGDLVHVRNIRNCTYRSVTDFDLAYYDATFDLTQLRTVHFMVETFSSVAGPAHTMMAFGFDDGQGNNQYVAISVELRREVGEAFHPLPGIFKQYELMYVVGDERDLIQLRTNHRKHNVYFYPIAAPQEDKRKLFVDMLQRANELRDSPAFYNTLTSSCATNIVRHVDRIAVKPLPFSYKVLLPAFSDELAYDLDLIDTDLSFEDAQKAFRIDEIARDCADGRPFSVKIRVP